MEDLFRREVQTVLAQGFKNVYIFGTAGEGYAIDTVRFRQIVRIFREETNNPDTHAMVGVIGLSTANIIERIQMAYEAGFRTFQISLPSWAALRDEEMLRFLSMCVARFPILVFYITTCRALSACSPGTTIVALLMLYPTLSPPKTPAAASKGRVI